MDMHSPTQTRDGDPNSDDIFSGLSQDPLVDAGYGPVSHVPRPKKPQNLGRKLLIAAVVLVVTAAIVTAGVMLVKHHKNTPKSTAKTNTNTSSTASDTSRSQTDTQSQAPATASKTYTSNETSLGLTFSYPDGWTVTPATTTAAGTTTIAATSPITTFTDANGASVKGRVTVTMRPSSAGISELTATPGTVAQKSVQIAYTSPTAGQHKYPYISFIHLPSGSKANGAFEEVMITGVTSFDAGKSIAAADLSGLDPIISVAFYACTGTTCTTPLGINNATWTNNATAVEALQLLESLQLK